MSESVLTQPIFFDPIPVERVWGGNLIAGLFNRPGMLGKVIGESWELSDRAEAQSAISGSELQAKTLHELLAAHPLEMLGPALAQRKPARFPLLIKYIDAGQPLSVQVHPDDATAKPFGDRGKAECWVVLHVASGARIVRGFKPGTTPAEYDQAMAADRIEDILHSFTPSVGDVIALPPGMVHAIGGGVVLAEIQQNSDLTFRIYDYKRGGLDGKPRKLHLDQARQALHFGAYGDEFDGDMTRDFVEPRCLWRQGGATCELLLDGRYFDLVRYSLPHGASFTLAPVPEAPRVLMVIEGTGSLNERLLCAGTTALLPAAAQEMSITANRAGAGLVMLTSTPKPAAW